MANKSKNKKEILYFALAVIAIISFFTMATLYADGHFVGTPMQRIVPPFMWSLFVGFEVMIIATNVFDGFGITCVCGVLGAAVSFVLGFFNLTSIVIITVAILGVIIAVMNILRK